jgi:hypothetical protein
VRLLLGIVALTLAVAGSMRLIQAQTNPVVVENGISVGNDAWDVSGAGDPSIQGFATDISVNKGQPVSFKIKTTAASYNIDIYRLGYYGGAGARKMATLVHSGAQAQPACNIDSVTGLADCGIWAVSATWSATATATSGIYVAKLTRPDTGGTSHIPFIIRDDARKADVVFQTSDTTWQAYNQYGGGSLYCGGPKSNAGTVYSCTGRATKVSYNRPFDTRAHDPQSFLFNAEYPMVRFLEANGYDVKYISGVDTERGAANLIASATMPKAFLSVGHDEYWSAGQRASVEAARNAGVNLAFFSGNEMYWKTRFETALDGTPYRTLVGYKDTLGGVKLDPMTGVTTGTWRDTRFGAPVADGGKPENGLIGQLWTVNSGSAALSVPASMAKLRLWKNTRVENLTSGSTSMTPNTIGYEWGEDLDNGFRPGGVIHLSSTRVDGVEKILDFGETVGIGSATHTLTLYKHTNGALVFGAGTVQWSWGLDSNHDRGADAPDQAMQQATVNLFADFGVQPGSLQQGADPSKPLMLASKSSDLFGPTSTITSPAGGTVGSGDRVTITGTATDSGGGVVAGVEVSVDGGATWRAATGTANWSFEWTPGAPGTVNVRTRAIDDSGNREGVSSGSTITIVPSNCPCPTLFSASAAPAADDSGDESPVELGVKFKSDLNGFVKGVRFYKSAMNTGTHVGNLWALGNATPLATATFANETASGWQEVLFSAPVPVSANTTYVVSYHTNVGHYSASGAYFATAGVDRAPLHAPASNMAGGNGVYVYGESAQPTNTFNATNYWVDVVFDSTPDVTAPNIADVSGVAIDSSTALVTWSTDEPATSSVDYSTDPTFATSTQTVTDGAFVTAHSVRLTGLRPSTAYSFRVRSTDRSGNTAQKPSGGPTPPPAPGQTPPPPQAFTMPTPTLHDTTSADFNGGVKTGTYVGENSDGELMLAPARGAEFSGSAMPAGWATQIWSAGGSATVANGKLTVDGARVATCAVVSGGCQEAFDLVPGASLEFVATFTGDPYQHSGLGTTLAVTGEPMALFSTTWTDGSGAEHSGSNLGVRTSAGSGALESRTTLGTALLNTPHRYRIDWLPGQMVYSVDGVEVARHTVAVTQPMRPVAASDYNAFSGNVVVDYVRNTPYQTAGSFLSRVFDGSTGISWESIDWAADVPSGTSLAIAIRTGNTAIPDSTWTPFTAIAAPGALAVQSRYIQYRADLASSDVHVTPVLSDLRITGAALPPIPPPPQDQTITFAPIGPKTFGNAPFALIASSSSGLPVTFSIVSGPASVAGNMLSIIGAGPVVVRASAMGGTGATGINYRPADDVDQTFVVAQATQTIGFGPLANQTLGSPAFALSATASSGLAVSFSIVSGPATLSGNMLSMTGAGIVKVRASQAGNVNYLAATPVEQSFTVIANTSSVIVTSSQTPALAGVPITLTATVSPTGATGAVSFKDGVTPIACGIGSVLTAPVATCKTSALAVGTHSITAVYAGSSSLLGSTSLAFSQVISPSAKLQVKFSVFTLLDNTSKPKVATLPAKDAVVKVFSTANACVGNLFKAIHPKKWGEIYDGVDGPGGVDGCPAVSFGSYQAVGTTDANGEVSIIVPPLALNLTTQYVVIGRATNFDYIKTAVAPDPLYSSYPVVTATAGTTRSVPLSIVATFNGKIVPGKRIEEYGSYLAIVEPEFMDWTDSVEQYPFVLVAEGDWGVETSVTPPDGFVSNEPVLTTEVVDNVSALQFTLTDIGSDWTETGITHVIKHKGETRIRTSAVPMFNKQPNAANGDAHAGNGQTQKEAVKPLLPSRLIAKLVGVLF